LNKSIGNNLTCLFIDNGLLRKKWIWWSFGKL
jgi:GMP synthase PP-ATPase subunit